MRTPRLKASPGQPLAYYHCYSHVTGGVLPFDPSTRNVFISFMRSYEDFCAVAILTFSVMSNHFHILAEVAARPAFLPPDEELLRRCARIYSETRMRGITRMFKHLPRGSSHGDNYRKQFFDRMHDVSQFMKELKQRFAQWYNYEGPHRRKGVFWAQRFGSTLIEGTIDAVQAMAAYIDLNPEIGRAHV